MGLNFFRRDRNRGHEQLRESLSQYVDGRLSAGERAAVESHLLQCQECNRELQALRATRQMLQSLPPVRLPRSFTLEAIPAAVPKPRGFYWLRAATGLAAAAFVVLLALPTVLPSAGGSSAIRQPAAVASQAAASEGVGSPKAQTFGQGAGGAESATGAQRSLAPAAAAQPPAAAQSQPNQATSEGGAPAPLAAASASTVHDRAAAPTAAAPAAAGPVAPNSTQALAQPAPSQAAVASPATEVRSRAEPAPQGAAVPMARSAAGDQTSASGVPGRPSLFLLLQGLAGGLALLLGVATGAIWWRHRR